MTIAKPHRRGVLRALSAALLAGSLPAFGRNAAAQTGAAAPLDRAAVPVSRFLDSLGIGIHHAQGVAMATYLDPLRYLGFRNIRDDFGPPESYVTLHGQTGIRAVLIADASSLDRTLAGYRRIAAAGALLAIEGPNEPNNFTITYKGRKGGGFGDGADWTAVAEFQRDLYAAVKADPALKDYPVFHVTEAGAQSPNVGLQFLRIPEGANTTFPAGTAYADFANVHNYVSSTKPAYVDNQAWHAADPLLDSVWDGLYVEYGRMWGHGYAGYPQDELVKLPRVTTETGWDSVSGIGGERVQGTVLLNTCFAQFTRGWSHTFIYMLRDGEGGAGNQGVFNADSTPKLAATFLHNLTTILAETGTPASAGTLAYAIDGQTPTVHDLLMQRSDGRLVLAVWNERVEGADRVVVRLGGPPRDVAVFDPTVGTAAVESHRSVGEVTLMLSDHPVLVALD